MCVLGIKEVFKYDFHLGDVYVWDLMRSLGKSNLCI